MSTPSRCTSCGYDIVTKHIECQRARFRLQQAKNAAFIRESGIMSSHVINSQVDTFDHVAWAKRSKENLRALSNHKYAVKIAPRDIAIASTELI